MPKITALHHLRSIEDLDEATEMERFTARTNLKKSKAGKPFSKAPLKKKGSPQKRREDDFDWNY